MTAPVRVGVVGAGWWSGLVHLPTLVRHRGAQVVGVCDIDAARARDAAEAFAIPAAVDSVEDLLAIGVDAAVVATPHDAHHEPAAALLDAGVHVLVEKPLATTSAEAWDLVRRADRAGAALHVGHPFPHSPHVRTVRELLRRGDIGQCLLVSALFATAVGHLYRGDTAPAQRATGARYAPRASTYADPQRGGGQLFTQLSHAASVVLASTGTHAVSVAAELGHGGASVDVADAVSARLADGTVATLASVGSVHADDRRVEEYRFFGADGHVLLDTAAGSLRIERRDRFPEDDQLTPAAAELAARPAQALVDCARDGRPAPVDGRLGAHVVDLLSAAIDAARSHPDP